MDHVRDRRDRCVRNASLVHFGCGQKTREILRSLRRPQNDNVATCKSHSTFLHSIWPLLGWAIIGTMLAAGPLSPHTSPPPSRAVPPPSHTTGSHAPVVHRRQ